jgi:hypothetical protein
VRGRVGEQPGWPARATWRVQGRIIGQYGLVEAGQRGAWPQPELTGEQLAELVVLCERLGTPTAPVERHELRDPQSFTHRVTPHHVVDGVEHVGMVPDRQLCLEPVLIDRQPAVLQPHSLGPDGGHPAQVHQRVAAPHRQRRLKRMGRARHRPVAQCHATLMGQFAEQQRIQLAGIQFDLVATNPVRKASLPVTGEQDPAERRNVNLEVLVGGPGKLITPQRFGKQIYRHNGIGVAQQQGKYYTLLERAERTGHITNSRFHCA